MDDCIFCKIVKGEIPCSKVYEDETVIGFLDVNPSTKGHTLIVPKDHVADFTEMDDEQIRSLFIAGKKIAKAVKDASESEGYNLVMNTGQAAGQVVMHAHLHVIPRKQDDGAMQGWRHTSYEQGEAEQFCEKIKGQLD